MLRQALVHINVCPFEHNHIVFPIQRSTSIPPPLPSDSIPPPLPSARAVPSQPPPTRPPSVSPPYSSLPHSSGSSPPAGVGPGGPGRQGADAAARHGAGACRAELCAPLPPLRTRASLRREEEAGAARGAAPRAPPRQGRGTCGDGLGPTGRRGGRTRRAARPNGGVARGLGEGPRCFRGESFGEGGSWQPPPPAPEAGGGRAGPAFLRTKPQIYA